MIIFVKNINLLNELLQVIYFANFLNKYLSNYFFISGDR